MNPDFNLPIFGFGCVGALSPELIRLYKLRTDPPGHGWSWQYFVLAILFGLLGGVMAWILPATTYYGAFYAGATAPITVSSIVKRRAKTKLTFVANEKETVEKKPKPTFPEYVQAYFDAFL